MIDYKYLLESLKRYLENKEVIDMHIEKWIKEVDEKE